MTFIPLLVPLVVNLLSLLSGYDDAELLFAGDAMQHQAQIDAARRQGGTWDYSQCFSEIQVAVEGADFAVVNLETPLGEAPHTGYPCFNAPAAWADALAGAGFDLFLTANNHTLDRRSRGLRSTIDSLDRRNIRHIGTYRSAEARSAALPMVVEVNRIKVAFLNYTYGTNGITPGEGVVVDYIDRRKIASDVAAARVAGAEIVCVCMHWGNEYSLMPCASQRAEADYLESLGVDLIIGAHPHVVQPLEFRENRYFPDRKLFLAWSLGNLISNMKTADTRGGLLARVRLHRGADGVARVGGGDYELLFTIPAGQPPESNFRVVPADADSIIPAAWHARRNEFVKRARNIFMKHNIGVEERRSLVQSRDGREAATIF